NQLQSQISELEHQLESVRQSRSELESQLTSQLSQLQSQIETANQNQTQLQSQVSELENQLETVRQTRSELESQLETANRERSHLYSQLSEFQSQIETANQNQAQLQSQVSDLEHQLETVYQERLLLTSQLSEAGSRQSEHFDSESGKIEASTSDPKVLKSQKFVVSQQGQGDYTTISEALKNAAPGTRIDVHPGVYRESLILDKSVDIIGSGEVDRIVVESISSNCIKMVTDTALVRGLTLSATGKYYAVDIRQGELIIEDSDITSADYSVVGICGPDANSTLRRTQIHDGVWNGIFISDDGKATVEDCSIFDNGSLGIGVGLGGKLIVRRCRINGNEGAAIGVYRDSIATVEDSDLTGNSGGAWRIADNGYVRGKGNQE
ncbi:right-handed parallel beta-helix repeat-containing protein, partial [Microcoleus sp. MON1_C5]|uniref:right-handed parallel beta-helix repeat-containing protein n=1 Tax=Microcoleus sp. MON1_C5 TaxID=2818828 RepID=UPI002FD345D2